MKRSRVASARRTRRADTDSARDVGLHTLSLRLETAREEERARLARELHDDLGQVLTSLKLEFMWLVDELGKGQPKPGIQLVNKLQSLVGLIEVSIQSVRQISTDLRPAVLDHLGLQEAIQWEATKFEARTGIRCRLTSWLTHELRNRTKALAVFRILQEALVNVRKHARASRVDVRLDEREGGVFVSIQDDGEGFSPDIARVGLPGHLGLTAMRERAEMAGGWLKIVSRPGSGTSVNFWVPAEKVPAGRVRT